MPRTGCRGSHLEGPDGESTVVESRRPAALMIRRVEFDALLVELAREAGAELIDGVDIVRPRRTPNGVTVTARDGRRFEASVVIAADGVHSVVARRLGLNPGWPDTAVALDMMEETPRADAARRRSVDAVGGVRGIERAGRGYAYIFPKRDHVNVGIGYVLDHYRRSIDAHRTSCSGRSSVSCAAAAWSKANRCGRTSRRS